MKRGPYKLKVVNPGWFKKGVVPKTAWKKGERVSPGTEFKKGHVPFSKLHPEKMPRGEAHHNWKGDSVTYAHLHRWMRDKLGKPCECDNCMTTRAKYYDWANVSGEYRRERSDWRRLCRKCHRQYDSGLMELCNLQL